MKVVVINVVGYLLLAVSVPHAEGGFSFEPPAGSGSGVPPQPRRPKYCPPGQKLVRKPEGLICMKDLSYLWSSNQNGGRPRYSTGTGNSNSNIYFTTNPEPTEVVLPFPTDLLTSAQEKCFSQGNCLRLNLIFIGHFYWPLLEQILWTDGRCYPLAKRGPCEAGEWLVISEADENNAMFALNTKIKASCRKLKCPCLASDPDFCEVEVSS